MALRWSAIFCVKDMTASIVFCDIIQDDEDIEETGDIGDEGFWVI